MPRLDVYAVAEANPPGYVVDVQSSLLDHLATRVVVPLAAKSIAPLPIRDMNPDFEINGGQYTMLTQFISSIPARNLRNPVASLAAHHDAITRALDILLLGF